MTRAVLVSDPLLEYVAACKAAGLPADQVQRFITAGYVAFPGLLRFHALAREADNGGIREIVLHGTRGSAKSHAVIAQVGLDDCQRRDGLKVLFLRRTERAAAESFADLVGRVLRGVPHVQNAERVEFPNSSRIMLGGYKDSTDIDKYLGIEYDSIVIEELTQLEGEKINLLLGSLRTSRGDWTPRLYATTNPGGVGHVWAKARYIDPARAGSETNTRAIFTSWRDNPFIDKGYRDYLEGLTGDLRKAWTEGDWDVFAGQAFAAWRYDKHTIEPRELSDGWARWRSVDWGYNAPFCCLWLTRDPDNGRVFVYREAYETGLTDRQQARLIMDMTPPGERISVTYADPSMWAAKTSGATVTSTADEYAAAGVPLTKADNDRLSGKRKVDRLLEPLPDGAPGLVVFKTCANLIRTLPALTYDKVRVEDVDSDQEDHAFDALKYGLTQAREYKPPTPGRSSSPFQELIRNGR